MVLVSLPTPGRMLFVKPRLLLLPFAGITLASCAVENGPKPEDYPSISGNVRIKDRVLTILCDNETRNVQQDLTKVVNAARGRDGRSDLVWEVADNANCQELQRSTSQTG